MTAHRKKGQNEAKRRVFMTLLQPCSRQAVTEMTAGRKKDVGTVRLANGTRKTVLERIYYRELFR